ncbi:MAG: ribonuclease Y [Candidatus Omnitrophota bacterium]|jgi:ribonuclease Y|nr:MAG: ribonuclease Y [Candidatus Omnitrophota bacterium]
MEWIGTGIALLVGLAVGFLIGFLIRKILTEREIGSIEQLSIKIREEAQKEAATIKKEAALEAKEQLYQEKTKIEQEAKERRAEITALEKKLDRREETIDKRQEDVEKLEKENNNLSKQLERRSKDLEKKDAELSDLIQEQRSQLEKISGLTSDAAKELLLRSLESDVRRESARIIKQITDEAKEKANREARRIIATTMQRGCTEYVNESTVSTVALPSDDIKGRIIGREGRNIRAFESLTGVNLIIDDTPDTVVLSAFDPVRREAARQTLERLISDGRIHPGRIEEIYDKVMKEMEEDMREAAERVVFDLGIVDMNPELIKIFGRLKYRFSYGQNQLYHAREVAFLAGAIASELGADIEICKRGALLHDLGKGIDFERDGTHAAIGAEMARKLGESKEVVNAIAAHHEDVEMETVEAVIVQVADALSAARPGARRETIETYVKRLEKLETLAESFNGVEKCFAIQAGREIRIMVEPEEVDDQNAVKLAYDVSKKIEEEMEYPGQIKVTIIRETRAVAYAK